jgi:flagellar hook-associated protein 1 FlgK
MSGMFRGLQIGLSALMAHQRAIDVTSHNIANANSPGYQRQRINLHELSAPSGVINPPLMGMGVYAKSVNRYATPFIDQQIRRQQGALDFANTTENLLRDVESVLTEPSISGISASLDGFWEAWQDLTVTPTEKATRIALVQSASQLTATIQESAKFITSLSSNLDSQVQSQVNRVNDIASEIAALNEQIIQANAQAGGTDGAIPLEQRRDGLLFELSGIIDFDLSVQDGGLARVTVGNYALVNDGGAKTIQLDDEKNLIWDDNLAPVKFNSGMLKAVLDMRDQTLPTILSDLDTLTQGLINNVNALHRNGYGMDGTTGLEFFTGQDASTLSVDPLIVKYPESIATAGEPNRIGDITNALAIANLSTQPSMGTSNNVSINGFFRGVVTKLGMQVQQSQASGNSSRIVVEHLNDRRQSISGVSMDEEVASLLSYEKAFQAGARIINVIDEMLDQVINRMGLVGR